MDFHHSNLEFACGAALNKVTYWIVTYVTDSAFPLAQVSSFNWDHNDNFPQFSGCHALIPDGYMSILSRLADGFDVVFDSVVKHVELVRREGEREKDNIAVRVTDTRGNEAVADRVTLHQAPTNFH